MTSTATFSQDRADLVSGCNMCPLGRHLDGHRFACADRVYATDSRHAATQECRDAITEYGHKYYQPLPLEDLHGVGTDIICNHIKLDLDWIDIDEESTPDGHDLINVLFQGHKVGSISKTNDWYSCSRIVGVSFKDEYYLALHMIHPDFLYGVADEILIKHESFALQIAAKGIEMSGILRDQPHSEYI